MVSYHFPAVLNCFPEWLQYTGERSTTSQTNVTQPGYPEFIVIDGLLLVFLSSNTPAFVFWSVHVRVGNLRVFQLPPTVQSKCKLGELPIGVNFRLYV